MEPLGECVYCQLGHDNLYTLYIAISWVFK